MKNLIWIGIIACTFWACQKPAKPIAKIDKVQLGKLIFFDTNLSDPSGQSCASCHAPTVAFSDEAKHSVSPGAVEGRGGNRNAPAIMYAKFIPKLQLNREDSTYTGGLFLDGRAPDLKAQAKAPFFNPLEMNLQDEAAFALRLKQSAYYTSIEALYGKNLSDSQLLEAAADAIAAYESSDEVNPFSSKFDAVLSKKARFTKEEAAGFDLFNGKAKCAECHPSTPDPVHGKVLFTDFSYDNLGVPRNPENPIYQQAPAHNPFGQRYLDLGLSFTTQSIKNSGQFRVPTLRNIALTAPYFHNGFFPNLAGVVRFYNKRDVDKFPAPEIPRTVNRVELGNLKLSPQEEHLLVVFLKTLSDGYQINAK